MLFGNTGDSALLLLVLLFVFAGGESFDVTQLLLALALFSTLGRSCESYECRGDCSSSCSARVAAV